MDFLNKHSFKNKLFTAFIVIGVIPLLLMALISYFNTTRLIEEKISSSIVQNLETTSSLVDSKLRDFTSIVGFISQNKEVQQILSKGEYESYEDRFADVQRIYNITSTLLATERLDVPIYISGKSALSRFSTTDNFAPIYTRMNGEIFKKIDGAEGRETLYIHRRVDGRNSRDVVMAVGMQIRNSKDSEKLGYVVMDVYDDYFNDIFKNVNIYSGSNMYVLNKDGTIITDKLDKDKTGFLFYEKFLDKILSNESGNFNCTIDGEKNVLYFTTAENSGLKIVETIPIKIMYKDSTVIVRIFIIIALGFSILAVVSSLILSKYISEPINKLSRLMHKVEKGDRDVSFDLVRRDEIGQLGKSFNNMLKEINRLIEEVYIKQYLLKEAEFKALKAQVNPHFLYNALESINWMVKLEENDRVVLMVTALGKFLRYSISSKGDIVTVKEDIEQVNNYLTIQKIRYGDKINAFIDIDEDLYDKKIMKLLLQPLVENAIIHGLEQKRGEGNLWIKGYAENGNLCFEVIDDGVGMGNSLAKGEGIGIKNVDSRIKLHYGEDYGVTIENREKLTSVKVVIPYKDKGD